MTRRPYRWLRHPNYLAVVLEQLSAPLMFGAWRTAIAISLANLVLLRIRIRCEERALDAARNAANFALVDPEHGIYALVTFSRWRGPWNASGRPIGQL